MSKEPFSIQDLPEKATGWFEKVPNSLRGLLLAVIFVWVLELIDVILPGQPLNSFGVRPRSILGLIGIPLMPFLHGGIGHLFSNTLPFLILGWIVYQAEGKNFIAATVVIILLGGLGTWLIAGEGELHIGASGLVYGYFGYIIARAFLERDVRWIFTGLVVGFFFGSMIFGAIPGLAGYQVSWEGHLCGLLAGGWFGWRKSKELKAEGKKIPLSFYSRPS